MKYKKQIATGALALSLLVGGTNVFASTPQDLGIKNTQKIHQKQNRGREKENAEFRRQNNIVGIVGALTSSGFTVSVTNMKTKATSSVDIATDSATAYKKDGLSATSSDLVVGQKVIVKGNLDKTTNILTAKTVKIITKTANVSKIKKTTKTN